MDTLIINIKRIAFERRFSAEGANLVFNHIDSALEKSSAAMPESIILDFENIDLVSTSFIGRLQTRISIFKSTHSTIKIKLINLRPEIKRQFLRNDDQK